jgi:RNA recognition motif-containing protein
MPKNNNSIIVKDLGASINVTVLMRHFSSAGSVAEVHISHPTGTAIVTFKDSRTADFAVENLNCSTILGRPCRVSRIPVEPLVPEVPLPTCGGGASTAARAIASVNPFDNVDTDAAIWEELERKAFEIEQMRSPEMFGEDGHVRITPEIVADARLTFIQIINGDELQSFDGGSGSDSDCPSLVHDNRDSDDECLPSHINKKASKPQAAMTVATKVVAIISISGREKQMNAVPLERQPSVESAAIASSLCERFGSAANVFIIDALCAMKSEFEAAEITNREKAAMKIELQRGEGYN